MRDWLKRVQKENVVNIQNISFLSACAGFNTFFASLLLETGLSFNRRIPFLCLPVTNPPTVCLWDTVYVSNVIHEPLVPVVLISSLTAVIGTSIGVFSAFELEKRDKEEKANLAPGLLLSEILLDKPMESNNNQTL